MPTLNRSNTKRSDGRTFSRLIAGAALFTALVSPALAGGGPPPFIGDFVWIDSNTNGLQDVAEPGVQNVLVSLFDSTSNLFVSTFTSPSGQYQFTNIPNGVYFVSFAAPLGYFFTEKDVATNSLDNTDSDSDVKGISPLFNFVGNTISNIDAGLIQYQPDISLTKVVQGVPDGGTLYATNGQFVVYTYTVTNSGNTFLANIFLEDDILGTLFQGFDCPTPLSNGASFVVTSAPVQITASVTNEGHVFAGTPTDFKCNDLGLTPVEAFDPAIVIVTAPGFTIDKTLINPVGQPAAIGEAVTFQLSVVNTGDVTLVTVPLTDTYNTAYLTFNGSIPPSDDTNNDGVISWANVGPLAPGSSTNVIVNFIAAGGTPAGETNVVVTTPSTPPGFPPVPPGTNVEPYEIISVHIDKTFASATQPDGGGNFVATYVLSVSNTSGVAGPYDLEDTPNPDPNVTITGGNVTGQTNLVLVGAGPYTLASGVIIAAGATHTYTVALDAVLSPGVINGTTNVSTCAQGPQNGPRSGLFNGIQVTIGADDTTVTTNDCGEIPPFIVINKSFVSASEPDNLGNFAANYLLTVKNSGGSVGTYDISDDPGPDTNVTITGGAVSGQTNLVLVGPGPYVLGTNVSIGAGVTQIYTVRLDAVLSVAVVNGSTNVTPCASSTAKILEGFGLYNLMSVTFGTNQTTSTSDDCGNIPPFIVPTKTFISASDPDASGNFVVTYVLTAKNTGGTPGQYDMSDTPAPDTNVTINGGTVSGQTNLVLVGAGPFNLGVNIDILPGVTHTYTMQLNAVLSVAILKGTTNVTACGQNGQGEQAGEGLFNSVTITYGTNNTTATTDDCGDVPPVIVLDKTFISASDPDLGGNFVVTYTITAKNSGGSSGPYSMVDQPAPDTNVTISGGTVSGQTNLVLVGPGPYLFASNVLIAAGETHTYTVALNAVLSPGVLSGSTNISQCTPSENGQLQPNKGLFNVVVVSYGTNQTIAFTNDCGNVPPVIIPTKTFISASAPDLAGNFEITYVLTEHNVGGSEGPYDLTDTPAPDPNITISGGNVTGQTNLALVGAGPYTLANDVLIAAGATHTYTVKLNAALSPGVLKGTTNVTTCGQSQQGDQPNEGLFNAATVSYGTNSTTVTTNDCGDIPPFVVINKTFLSAGPMDGLGNFMINYRLTAHNTGGSTGPYDLTDTPAPDTNVTITGGAVTGQTNLVLVGAGPYVLASNVLIDAGVTHTYTMQLNAVLSPGALAGTNTTSDCGTGGQGNQAGQGLFNGITVEFGTNNVTTSTNACGDVPPIPRFKISKALTSPLGRPAVVGEQIVFTITITNNGEVVLNPVQLTDTFNSSLLAYASATPPESLAGAGFVTWGNVGPLGIGSSTAIVVRFTALAQGNGTNFAVGSPSTTNDIPLPPQTSSVPHSAVYGAIGDRVWRDLNNDGIHNENLTIYGRNDMTVRLFQVVGLVTNLYDTQITHTDGGGLKGFYLFTNLSIGTYISMVETDGFPKTYNWLATTPLKYTTIINGTNVIVLTDDFGFNADPNPVHLRFFEAVRDGSGVKVAWQTAAEWDNLGFNVYRADSASGARTRLNSDLISGLGTSPNGQRYELTDAEANSATTWFYWLEDISVNGDSRMHGPAIVDGENESSTDAKVASCSVDARTGGVFRITYDALATAGASGDALRTDQIKVLVDGRPVAIYVAAMGAVLRRGDFILFYVPDGDGEVACEVRAGADAPRMGYAYAAPEDGDGDTWYGAASAAGTLTFDVTSAWRRYLLTGFSSQDILVLDIMDAQAPQMLFGYAWLQVAGDAGAYLSYAPAGGVARCIAVELPAIRDVSNVKAP